MISKAPCFRLYHKQQKLSEKKVLGFTGCHCNVGKTSQVLFQKKPLLKRDSSEKLAFCRESVKTAKHFSCLAFIIYCTCTCQKMFCLNQLKGNNYPLSFV